MAQPQLAKGIVVDSVERLAPTAMLNDQWNVVKELVAATSDLIMQKAG